MKKQYSKPGIIIEDFKIAQNIATSCGINPGTGTNYGKPGHGDPYTCEWNDGIDAFWTDAVINCTTKETDFEVGGFCYNNPESGYIVFAS